MRLPALALAVCCCAADVRAGSLHDAARAGHDELVMSLLEHHHGAILEERAEYGRTALHEAADAGQLPIVKLLLANGAALDPTDDDGLTPLHDAVYNGHLDVVKLLLRKGAQVDARDRHRRTPLHRAAYQGLRDVGESLLKHGA